MHIELPVVDSLDYVKLLVDWVVFNELQKPKSEGLAYKLPTVDGARISRDEIYCKLK